MKRKLVKKYKKKRGFTLIELLAVILILGIIALIAIPTVTSVVEQSRKGSAETSANQFVVAVNELIVTSDLNGNKIDDGLYTAEQLQAIGLSIKGTMPDSGYVMIEDSEVVAVNFNYGNYNVTSIDENTKVSKTEEVSKFTMTEDNDSNDEVSVGDKICIDTECFYVISVNGDNVRMLTEWNLNVGYDTVNKNSYAISSEYLTGYDYVYSLQGIAYPGLTYEKIDTKNSMIKQDADRKGYYHDLESNKYYLRGIIKFNPLTNENYDAGFINGYWVDANNGDLLLSKYGTKYPVYVYDDNSDLSKYIAAYVNNLKIKSGTEEINGTLINYTELQNLACDYSNHTCADAPKWVYQTSYWTGTAANSDNVIYVRSTSFFGCSRFSNSHLFGLRPVVIISKNLIK